MHALTLEMYTFTLAAALKLGWGKKKKSFFSMIKTISQSESYFLVVLPSATSRHVVMQSPI